MKKVKKLSGEKAKNTAGKVGLGLASAGALGMALGGNAVAQERATITKGNFEATRAVSTTAVERPVMTVSAEQFLKNFDYTLDDKEQEVWRTRNVQATYDYLAKQSLDSQLKFLEDPEGYARAYNLDKTFGIEVGTRGDNISNNQLTAIAKNLKAEILDILANVKFSASCW